MSTFPTGFSPDYAEVILMSQKDWLHYTREMATSSKTQTVLDITKPSQEYVHILYNLIFQNTSKDPFSLLKGNRNISVVLTFKLNYILILSFGKSL